MRRIAKLGVVISLAAAAVVGNGLPAYAGPVSCGAVITANVVFTSDLYCPGPGPALRVLADVKVDLAGHSLAGDPNGVGIDFKDFSTNEQATNARVLHGRIAGFGVGIYADVYSTLSVDRLLFDHNGVGLEVPESQTVEVGRSEFSDNQVGIVADFTSASIAVSRSKLLRNKVSAFLGPLAYVTVDDSVIDRNGGIAGCSQGALSFHNTKITRNASGIQLFECTSEFVDTVYERNQGGISATMMPLAITRSRFAYNTGSIGLFNELSDVTITGSEFVFNDGGVNFSCQVACDAAHATIVKNLFARNGGDGLTITGGGTFNVSGNIAKGNNGWGLYAAPAVTVTGAGNKAYGNAVAAQCFGIPCN